MNKELYDKAMELKKRRADLQEQAMKLQGEMEKVKAEEKAAFGVTEGDRASISDIIELMFKVQ